MAPWVAVFNCPVFCCDWAVAAELSTPVFKVDQDVSLYLDESHSTVVLTEVKIQPTAHLLIIRDLCIETVTNLQGRLFHHTFIFKMQQMLKLVVLNQNG